LEDGMSDSPSRTGNAQSHHRNLIVCSDGTGNAGGKGRGTNVWRIFNAVERRKAPVTQIAFYDDGVGTEDWKLFKILGGAFGWGFTRNLIDLYSFLALNYCAGDCIFLFGFSRGAFTVRTLVAIITKCGLLDRRHILDEQGPRKLVKRIIRAYQQVDAEAASGMSKLRALREEYPELEKPVPIHFIGVFDTVDAVGVPMDELRGTLDWISRKLFKRRLYGFQDRILSEHVTYGCQALSIDDERKSFDPNLWEAREGVEQVWFSGSHSNVGGGYPKDGMALVPLEWMIEKGSDRGLFFIPEALRREFEDVLQRPLGPDLETEYGALATEITKADVHAQQYNPRKGLGVFFRYALRKLPPSALIHASVFQRIQRGTARYAPRVIPEGAEAAISGSGPYSQLPQQPLPTLTPGDFGQIARLAELRTRTYGIFISLILILVLVVAVGLWKVAPQGTTSLPWAVIKAVIPEFLEKPTDLAAAFPWPAAGVVLVFLGLWLTSSRLRKHIHVAVFRAWRRALQRAGWEDETKSGQAFEQSEKVTASRERRLKAILVGWEVGRLGLAAAAVAALAAMIL
jgi:uncharacterized protein (DUF2235 family)